MKVPRLPLRPLRLSQSGSIPIFTLFALSLINSVPRLAVASPQSGASPPGHPTTQAAAFNSHAPSSIRQFGSTTALGVFDSFQDSSAQDNTMAEKLREQLTPALLLEVKDFWFEHLESADSFVVAGMDAFKRWFMGGHELDQICVSRFAPTLEALRASGFTTGAQVLEVIQPDSPQAWLGLVLLLDQIPRNCYRGPSSSAVFTFFDPIARDIALAAAEHGIPDSEAQIRWQFAYRHWFYVPLMHTESLEMHDKAAHGLGLMEADMESLANNDATPEADEEGYRGKALKVVQADVEKARGMIKACVGAEKTHRDLIVRFGRYPHRNVVLGRKPTVEETEYLEAGGETFAAPK